MEPNWAEILEAAATAVGAGAAIYAGYYAYKAYKKQNKDVQDQINSLKTLAQHQAKENELLTRQLGVNANILQVERKKRKGTIRPHLRFGGGTHEKNIYSIHLHNHGEIAYKLEMTVKENENDLEV